MTVVPMVLIQRTGREISTKRLSIVTSIDKTKAMLNRPQTKIVAIAKFVLKLNISPTQAGLDLKGISLFV
jgi:hypothetical protein